MRHRRRGSFVDERAAAEPAEREGRGDWVRLPACNRGSEDVAGTGRRLEAAGAPARVDIEAGSRRQANDRRAVGGDVDYAAPVPQHLQAPEDGEQIADRVERVC